MLIVDALACSARKVPLAGLPLLAVYSVPISVLDGGVSLWVFVPTALGFMTLLYLHEDDLINRWGRSIGTDTDSTDSLASFGVRTGAARSSATAIGSVVTGLAIVVPLLIPTLDLHVFDFGAGKGGDSNVKIQNPTADLLRDLNRGEDIPLIQIITDDPDPDYLRVTSLNRFSANEWSPGNRDIPSDHGADGAMPPLQGVSSRISYEEYGYQVSINDSFESAWLPTQFPISSVTADGDWRYDDNTMDFFAWDEDLDTRNLDYSMTGVELDLDGSELAAASLSVTKVPAEFRELPDDLPALVKELAFGVTADAATRFDKAVALQNWFRANFEYNLNKGPRGNGVNELEAFLTVGEGGRVGYCEQFAASMAVMARAIGIPARMAVGFLSPEKVKGSDDEYVYSAHDLHAWPELYFDGYGWVMFEPTPATEAARCRRTRPGEAMASRRRSTRPLPRATTSPELPTPSVRRRPHDRRRTRTATTRTPRSHGCPWSRLRRWCTAGAPCVGATPAAAPGQGATASGRPRGRLGGAAGNHRGPADVLGRLAVTTRDPRSTG